MTTTSTSKETLIVRSPLEQQLDVVATQAPPRKNKAFLMVSTGEAAGMVFPITEETVLIGRSLDAEVRLNEQAVSSEHAKLEQVGGAFTLRDLGSTNGTYVNGQRLVDRVVLAGGDAIRIASTTFTFVTRESGLPKGTVKLTNPDPELPVEPHRDRPEVESVAMTAVPNSEREMSLTDVVRTVRTYWVYVKRYGWLAAVCLCFGITAGVVQAWVRPPPGSAWFEMSLTGGGGRDDRDDAPQFFVGPESTFRSLPLIKRTLEELGSKNVSDAMATEVQNALTFERVGFNSKVWHGDFQASTADGAATFLAKHVHVYIDSELDKILKVLRTDAEFDRTQEEAGAGRVAEARNRLVAFSDEHPEAVPKDAKLPNEARARLAPNATPERIQQSIASAERALRAEYTAIQSKKARPYIEQAAATETKIAEARARGLRDQHPEVRSLLNLQASMRARANGLLTAEPSESEQSLDPRIAQLKEEIASLNERLAQARAAQGPGEAPTTVSSAVATSTVPGAEPGLATPKVAPITAPVQAPPTAESLSELKIQYAELAREYERAKTEQDALIKKRETTERQLERERTSAEARYDIITPPTPAKASMFTAMLKRGGIGGMLGLGLALVASAVLELRRILIVRGHI